MHYNKRDNDLIFNKKKELIKNVLVKVCKKKHTSIPVLQNILLCINSAPSIESLDKCQSHINALGNTDIIVGGDNAQYNDLFRRAEESMNTLPQNSLIRALTSEILGVGREMTRKNILPSENKNYLQKNITKNKKKYYYYVKMVRKY
jgi:hypothetical protein